jgi:hypothetical protein
MQKVRYRFKNFNSLLTISFRSFHLYKSFFHLSLTVLIHYRSPIIFSIEGGTPMFRQKTALLLVLQNLNLQGYNLLWLIIQFRVKSPFRFRSPLLTESRLIFLRVT